MNIKSIIEGRAVSQYTVTSDTEIRIIVTRLSEEDAGALIVSDDNQSILGIISERDIVRALDRRGDKVLGLTVEDLMTKNVQTCRQSDTLLAVMNLMQANRIRHVPVVSSSGELLGMVGIIELIEHRMKQLQAEADAMQKYISG